jgi:Ala-tRNA(Pro) deacylase
MEVTSFLAKNHRPFAVIGHRARHGGQRLAQCLHVSGARIAKSVLLRADDDSRYVMAVLPATRHINLKAASQLVGIIPLHLATEAEIEKRCPGCELGVLSPFGSRYGIRTIVDASLAEDEHIFVATSRSEAIEMCFGDYCDLEAPLIGSFATSE